MIPGPPGSVRPDDPGLADAAAGEVAAYVHIPFCARICPYCDFAVVAGRDDRREDYATAVLREIDMEPSWRPLSAVSVGGGTPSRMPPGLLAAIVERLRDRFGLTGDAEVSLEANPEDWTPARSDALRAAGFDRVSFGVQSFDPAVLGALGRLHTPEEAAAAVRTAKASGFRSVNVDLIFGTPGESVDAWRRTLDRALELDPDHVSTYALTVERGTALSRAIRSGAPAPDPDLQADAWELADAVLAGAGLVRYEVSNHARPGHHCRYNLVVWAGGEYLGFGAGAHGHRDGVRRRNVRRLDAYLDRITSGVGPVQGADPRAAWEADQERLMVGLRRTAGAVPGPVGERLLSSEEGRRLVDAGVVAFEDGRLRVSRPLLTDEVVRAVLDLAPDGPLSVSGGDC